MASASVPGIQGWGNPDRPALLGLLNSSGLLTVGTQLDRQGLTPSLPGTCLQCHGSHSTSTAPADHKVHRGRFVPCDLDACACFSHALHSARSCRRQEDGFRAQSRLVPTFSRPSHLTAVRKLIDGWSDGALCAGTVHGSGVPPAWPGTEHVYPPASPHLQLSRKVSIRACRTCPISDEPSTKRAPEVSTIASPTATLSGWRGCCQRQRQKRRGRWGGRVRRIGTGCRS